MCCHCPKRVGRPSKRRESQKTCLKFVPAIPPRTEVYPDLEDKKGTSPDRYKSVRGFFLPGPLINIFSRRRTMQKEQTHLKMTLRLIRDWDGFQIAMRKIMSGSSRRGNL